MAGFLAAHGYEPPPTQRPLLAGGLSGLLATAPAIALLDGFGALAVEARILGLSVGWTLFSGAIIMAMAGALYARLFGRAANHKQGGWLFGMAFAFVLWAAGAVMILPLLSGGQAPAGLAAVGVFLSLILWGASLGTILPFVQQRFHGGIDEAAGRVESGPRAAAARDGERRA